MESTAEMLLLWKKKPTADARNFKSACMINDNTIKAWNHVACTLKKLYSEEGDGVIPLSVCC